MKHLVLTLLAVLGICWQAIAIEFHTVTFYIDQQLVTDLNYVKAQLPKYISDMNFVLGKNTGQQLAFNPNTGIVVTDQNPYDGAVNPNAPLTSYDVWIRIRYTPVHGSPGGTFSSDSSGAGVIVGTWPLIYNPDALPANSVEFEEYWYQVTTLMHEFAHLEDVATGNTPEYYSQAVVDDMTGVPPITNIRLLDSNLDFNVNDTFWGDHLAFATDPMLIVPAVTSRSEMLAITQFSDLSAFVMFAAYRPLIVNAPVTSLNPLRTKITDYTCQPINNARVRIWITGFNLLFHDAVTVNGEIVWNWTLVTESLGADALRTVKIHVQGFEPLTKYVSALDLQYERVVGGHLFFTNTFTLKREPITVYATGPGVIQISNTVPGRPVIIQASQDLIFFTPIATNIPSGTIHTFVDPNAGNYPHRFYRALDGYDCNVPIPLNAGNGGGEQQYQQQAVASEAERKPTSTRKVEVPPLLLDLLDQLKSSKWNKK